MKFSNGLTRTWPTIGMFVLYGLSFVPMTMALREMEVGAVYAIWSAVGTAVVAVLGVFFFHENANLLKIVAIVLIVTGVVCLDLSARLPARTESARNELRSQSRIAALPGAAPRQTAARSPVGELAAAGRH